MRASTFSALSSLALLGTAACSDYDREGDNTPETAIAEGNATGYASDGASTAWPEGSRIIVEDGVTYRIEPGGTRIRLGETDSRVVVENGISYRVDPDGTRVRIDPSGAEIQVDSGRIEVDPLPGDDRSVEVNNQ
ncbi:MAG: hypothetical protein LOX97_01180 [Sphingomonas sp.]|nr:hypothetical protein [Sphingomonas sp.]